MYVTTFNQRTNHFSVGAIYCLVVIIPSYAVIFLPYGRRNLIYNFFDLDYFSNIVDKFDGDNNFTLHMSTVGGNEENPYLEVLYEEYKNNPDKTQGYYFNLYKLDNEEKASFVQLINSKSPDTMEIFLDALPSKFELVIENKVIKSIKVIE